MSEYQYYEFLAIDRQLSPAEQTELRALSSRAEITSTGFANEYHWGDFRGNPDEMMARYFDAMIYVANWGSRHFRLRLPKETVEVATFKEYCVGHSLRCKTTAHHVILSFQFDLEGSEFTEDGEGWLAALVSLRADLLRGDMRALYLGWLACVGMAELDEQKREPPVPPELGKLSAPLNRLAEFIELDEDLLAAASEGSAGQSDTHEGLAEFITALPAHEKQQYLLDVALGKDPQLGAQLFARFRAALKKECAAPSRPPGRTVAELLATADRYCADRQRSEAQRAAKAEARRDAKAAKERALYLDELAGRADLAWQQIEENVRALKPKLYRDVAQLLVDLRDLAIRRQATDLYESRFADLVERHRGKSALMRELKQAGLLPGLSAGNASLENTGTAISHLFPTSSNSR